jgi:hypothetical protein
MADKYQFEMNVTGFGGVPARVTISQSILFEGVAVLAIEYDGNSIAKGIRLDESQIDLLIENLKEVRYQIKSRIEAAKKTAVAQ